MIITAQQARQLQSELDNVYDAGMTANTVLALSIIFAHIMWNVAHTEDNTVTFKPAVDGLSFPDYYEKEDHLPLMYLTSRKELKAIVDILRDVHGYEVDFHQEIITISW